MPFSGYDDLNGEFSTRLQAFQNAARSAGFNIGIGSGYRSPERQAQLFADAVRKYGSEEAARKWVAPPGKSNHGKGIAADLSYGNDAAIAWAHDNASRFGLHFPMSWEPWHIEPTGVEGLADRDAYTTPPPGHANPQDMANDPYSLDTQFRNFLGSMAMGATEVGTEVLATPEVPNAEMGGMSTQPEQIAGTMVEEMS